MCALAIQGAAAPVGAAEYELRLSAFRLRFSFVLSFLPFVIRAKRRFANASTGIGLLRLRMEHGVQSVVTVHRSAVP
jgi:hypothetical protein